MTLFKFFFTTFLFFSAIEFSCRYSQPFVKIQVHKKIEVDSSDFEKTISRKYYYFRISRYGILGSCRKTKTFDSTGTLRMKTIYKRSNLVSDGYTASLSKTKQFDKNGKLKSKSKEIQKDKGWGGIGKWKTKSITFDSAHKRIVTKTDNTLNTKKAPFKERFNKHKSKAVF